MIKEVLRRTLMITRKLRAGEVIVGYESVSRIRVVHLGPVTG